MTMKQKLIIIKKKKNKIILNEYFDNYRFYFIIVLKINYSILD